MTIYHVQNAIKKSPTVFLKYCEVLLCKVKFIESKLLLEKEKHV